jgi:ABC-type phosphate transport system auxiliary subunit
VFDERLLYARNMTRHSQLVAGLTVITTGVLLLLSNLHVVDVRDLGHYWPASLIVIGFGKLIADHVKASELN